MRGSRWAGLFLGSLILLSGCSEAPAQEGPDDLKPRGHGPIGGQREGVAYAQVATPGTTFTDGTGLLVVPGDRPAKVLKIESLGGRSAMTFLGAKLAGPHREFTTNTSWPTWPPNIAGDPLQEAEGATIEPVSRTFNKNGYELLLGYRIDHAKYAVRRGVRVTYRIGDRTYRAVLPLVFATCPPGRDLDSCQEEATTVMQSVLPRDG